MYQIYGCSLECYYKQGRGLYLYLYFLPWAVVADELSADVRNSYLQIEVWNGSLLANRILLPTLSSYEYLPTGFESLSQDDWTEFWSELIELSRKCQSAGRLLVMTQWKMFVFLSCSTIVLPLWVDGGYYPALIVILFILFSLLLLLAGFTSGRRFLNLITQLPCIVDEYADKFAQQGICIFHWCNPEGGHSIYLFPRTTFECCQNERDRSSASIALPDEV
jgi:hypothetical protein